MHAMRARKQHRTSGAWRATLISRSLGACDHLCEVHTYVQRTGACAIATVERRWTEEVDNLIALLDERRTIRSLEIILTEIKRRPSTR